ncbi:MAG: sensor histidine kinase [Gammaproteobacteria bacterium]|nr:sensor histidine kinase [Gammaproteobacteria bacterium]
MSDIGRQRSLRGQLLLYVLPPLFLLWGINVYWAYRSLDDAVTRAHDRTLLASARIIGDRVRLENERIRVDVPWVALDPVELDTRGRMYYQVLDDQGDFVSGFDDFPKPPAHAPRTRFYPALVSFRDDLYLGENLRVAAFFQPVVDNNGTGKIALVQVGETMQVRQALFKELLVGTLWRQGLLVLSGVAMILLAIHAALRPFSMLRRTLFGHARAGKRRRIDAAAVPLEIRPLAREINNYIKRLDGLHQRQRRFLADASHQLRTPLSVTMARVDHALEQNEPAHWYAALSDVRNTTRDTVRLTNQLLTLARADRGGEADKQGWQVVDLNQLVRQVCLEYSARAVGRQIDLGFEPAGGPVQVEGDMTLLHEMLANLVDNAVRYSRDGGVITVRVKSLPEGQMVQVEDDGPGIPEEKRGRVFERFYRLTPGDGQGSGLGLGIVRDVLKLHDGSISLTSGENGKGLCVSLVLPAAMLQS